VQPPYPAPPASPSGRRVPLVVWGAAGLFALLVVAGAAVLLISSRPPADPKVKGTLQLRKVVTRSDGVCPEKTATTSPDMVASAKSDACYVLGDGMTITRVKSVEMRTDGTSGWAVDIGLRPEDKGRLGALTGQIAGEQPPRDELAMVSNGRVISAPSVQEPITSGKLSIFGNFTRADAERYVDLFD
jgi:preprotein translocase subunit SecD